MRWAVAGFGILLLTVALVAPPGLVAFPSSPGQFTSTYPNTAGTKLYRGRRPRRCDLDRTPCQATLATIR